MTEIQGVKYYPPAEEKTNIISHGLGFILAIIAFVLLVLKAMPSNDLWVIVSFSIFGASNVLLYAASTAYHSAKQPLLRSRLRILDHGSIYILIAGGITPFALVTLHGTIGWIMFSVAWSIALIGVILKLFFTGRFNRLSTIMYVLMGWIALLAFKPLANALPLEGMVWLLAGGISYTLGAILYSIKAIPFNHAIFHIFVLIGSFCHFVTVYFYVLPKL
jgi:hemolysin III